MTPLGIGLLAGALLLAADGARAVDPIVSNVTFAQRTDGSRLVDVWYDLADDDDFTVTVTLRASDDDGATWVFPCRTVSGQVGEGVIRGENRHIVWDYGTDNPDTELPDLRVQVMASDAGTMFPAHSPRNVAIMDFSFIDFTDPAEVEKFSRADVISLACAHLWHYAPHEEAQVVAQIKALNPDCVLLGYMNWKNVFLWAENAETAPLYTELLERTRSWWSYTTAGDTLMDWPGKVVLNILDPECRETMIATFVEFQRSTANPMDGVFWDYFNRTLWIGPGVDLVGDPDLDGDGIPHINDADEMIAFRAAQVEMISALRDSLGEGFVQFFNGQRAYDDFEFAALADGVLYEIFPTLFFPDPDMQHALDPDYPYSLFNIRPHLRDQNGGPFMVMSNPWRHFYTDHNYEVQMLSLGNVFRAAALLVDGYSSWNDHSGSSFDYSYGWTDNDISLGDPLGPTVIDGNLYTRDFEYGRIEVEMTSGMYPDPFDYRIWINGRIVEELAIPYHFP